MSSPAVTYARQNHPRFLKELKDLLRIPSVSTLPENKGDCRSAAEFLAAEFTRIGMEHVRLIDTTGHPLVYADWLHAAGKPTVDRKSTRLNSSHLGISYAVFCLKK